MVVAANALLKIRKEAEMEIIDPYGESAGSESQLARAAIRDAVVGTAIVLKKSNGLKGESLKANNRDG